MTYAVDERVAVQAGVDFPGNAWAVGFLGARLTYAPRSERERYFALDGELGFGAGAGGRQNEKLVDQPLPWNRIPAVGSYLGLGVGYNVRFFSVYARGRFQAGVAEKAPVTAMARFGRGSTHDDLRRLIGSPVSHRAATIFCLSRGHTG